MQRQPADVLIQLAYGYRMARCLHAAVELGIPDALGEDGAEVDDLAEKTGCEPGALRRLMMTLAARDVFACDGDRFGHTDMSRLLRTCEPQSLDGFVRFAGADYQWSSWGALPTTIRTGQTAFDTLFGCNSFEYFRQNPDDGIHFDQAMGALAPGVIESVVEAYDFTRFSRIADMGGGRGHLLRGVLDKAPKAEGVLFDLPSVAEHARSLGGERMSFVGGDFFRDDLPAADAYLFMMILHDWSDADCVRILKNLRRTIAPGARVLLVEAVLPEDVGCPTERAADMTMLVMTGGRERTQSEYAALLREAGFGLVGPAIRTRSMMSIIEAEPA